MVRDSMLMCRRCGNDVHSGADSCPYCGAPVPTRLDRRTFNYVPLVAVGIMVFIPIEMIARAARLSALILRTMRERLAGAIANGRRDDPSSS
jgi:hypothetical protein